MNNINIYLEANPNPNSLKFVTDKMLVEEGIVKDYPDIDSATDSPIAKKLFEFDYVDRVFICLLYTSPSPRDGLLSRMPSSA